MIIIVRYRASVITAADVVAAFPRPLTDYPAQQGSLLATLSDRLQAEPFNGIATGIFLLAVVHTFAASWFAARAHDVQHAYDARAQAEGRPRLPSVRAELLHFLGEIEVVFGLWAVVLVAAITAHAGWGTARHYLNDTVNYTEPLFVVVVMALASTRPVVGFAESVLRKIASLGGGTPAAWWMTILSVGPVLGSLITEPAAMTISALLLARQFYDLRPSMRLMHATLGLLFVNVSIGGTLTHFAAPPVLMVARHWEWDSAYMLSHFGWRAVLAVLTSNLVYLVVFRKELRGLAGLAPRADIEQPDEAAPLDAPSLLPVPGWLVAAHLLFLAWTVMNSHYPALFLGGFLFFLGFARATAAYQSHVELRTPLLVGFFLGGLVIHGALQGWWIAPVLGSLAEFPLFTGAMILTAFNDNALITYLATLVPNLSEPLKLAVVEGAVVGGGLTVIANAPNPAGQALLGRFFPGGISPVGLLAGAVVPTLIAALAFRLL
ncbi:putative Na+/H+ antiporter [soil metagenome]